MGKMKTIQIIIEELQEQNIHTTIEELTQIHTNKNIPINELQEYIQQNKKQSITM